MVSFPTVDHHLVLLRQPAAAAAAAARSAATAQISWAAARPGPSTLQRMGRGPTQPIAFSIFQGPARRITISNFSARLGLARYNFALGPDQRRMTSPGIFPFFFIFPLYKKSAKNIYVVPGTCYLVPGMYLLSQF